MRQQDSSGRPGAVARVSSRARSHDGTASRTRVMAAGVGSRFGGLKQLEPVGPGGERLIDYSIFDALRSGVKRVVFVIRREMETDFHALVGARFAGGRSRLRAPGA